MIIDNSQILTIFYYYTELTDLLFLGVEVEEYVITEYDTKQESTRTVTTPKDKNILPEFPFKNPADLQLFELDCMSDEDLVQQLVRRS